MVKKFVLALLLISLSFSQQKLSLEKALALALDENYDIQIARNNHKNAEKDVYTQLNSFLPSIFISGGSTRSSSAFDEFRNNIKLRTVNQSGTTFNGSWGFNYRIDDIYSTILNYCKALDSEDESYHNQIANIQQTVVNVMNAYFDLAKQQNLLKVRERAVETSQEQVRRAQSRYEIGSAAKKDIYSAKVQLNGDKTSLLNQKLAVQRAKNTLNIALGREPFNEISVIEKVIVENKYEGYNVIEEEFFKNNPSLKAQNYTIEKAKIDKQIAFANLWLPSFSVTAGYTKSVTETGVNKTTERLFANPNTDFRASASITASYSLSLGQYINDQKSEIMLMNAELRKAKQEKQLKASLYQSWITYENAKEVLKVQEENLEAAREDLRLAQERFNLGSGTSLELRQAQDGLTQAETNLVNARYDAKLAEVEIDRLLGIIRTE